MIGSPTLEDKNTTGIKLHNTRVINELVCGQLSGVHLGGSHSGSQLKASCRVEQKHQKNKKPSKLKPVKSLKGTVVSEDVS